ncbi:MAG: YdcF family protein [Deltaproteobacteria bacterium]|nr:YdcF family protein [Deltaproteobacteria bacterium]
MKRFCVLVALVSGCATVPPPHGLGPADAIVVLGNRPPVEPDGSVRFETRKRVEAGVRVYRRGLAPILLMAGGPAPSGHVEAEVMRDLAIELGVPASAIRIEPRSTDTIENARFSVALLCEGQEEPCTPHVIVVTSPYHLRRAEHLFECAGARVQTEAAEVPARAGRVFSESFIRVMYGFTRECHRAADGEPTREAEW